MSSTTIPKIVPAQLSFLAIYNPTLGSSDATFRDQVVFYYSKASRTRSRSHGKHVQTEEELRESENEKLRQIGLAQGIVGFARSFSNGAAVDSVETQKSRIVLHELERNWWILASVDLTRLPVHTSHNTNADPAIEYSSREVSPPTLLIRQLVQAHRIYLLHHGAGLSSLLRKQDRVRLCASLDRYWSLFASNWDVLLHGSPAVDIYAGMKLAAGGELGMGVGEEEWGSGERLVLEDYVHKTEGLVDLVVSRFGEPSPAQWALQAGEPKKQLRELTQEPWLGGGSSPSAQDGVVFSGVGALSRRSLRDLSHWIETIYQRSDAAYGVRDNPTADRRACRKPRPALPGRSTTSPSDVRSGIINSSETSVPKRLHSPVIPPPIVRTVEESLSQASKALDARKGVQPNSSRSEPPSGSLGDTETWVKYLTLGYGSAWGSKQSPSHEAEPYRSQQDDPKTMQRENLTYVEPQPDVDLALERRKTQIQQENSGYFAVGLKGALDDADVDDENDEGAWNNRTLLRTVHVEMSTEDVPETPGADDDETPAWEKEFSFRPGKTSRLKRLRPVVYIHRPFIYTFLFRHRTELLNIASFYRHLHGYFSPLHRPLSNSTSADRIAARLSAAYQPYTTSASDQGSIALTQPIYDLAYDPRTLTVHSSIPNIPELGTLIAEGLDNKINLTGWSRLEAINVHSQVIATVTSTSKSLSEIERTGKTNRGWWIVWMRLPPSQMEAVKEGEAAPEDFDTDQLREAFLVRRSRDAAVAASAKSTGSRFGSGMFRSSGERAGGAAAGWGPRGLAEGIGIDARRYVEGLLSLNR